MANRRMMSMKIIDTDLFLELPSTTQLLYFHLLLRGDDDGFIDKPKTIIKIVGCKSEDMNMLVRNGFVIPFESGVCVIKHWKIHNYIQKDRYAKTMHQSEMKKLSENNGVYDLYPDCIQTVSNMDTQVSIELIKDSIEEVKKTRNNYTEDFEKLWLSYERKGSKSKSFTIWKKLTEEEKTEAINYVTVYKQGREKKYCKDLERYLKNKLWEGQEEQTSQMTEIEKLMRRC